MKEAIKVGFCIAYDWYLLEHALPLIYADADQICLSIDRDRISWSGARYAFDEDGFRALLKRIDIDGKIKLLEDNYHLSDLSPMANEVRQRNCIAEFQGKGGWHIQLDCDEYFYDFKGFVHYLRAFPQTGRALNICCPWITLYKQVADGFLYVDPVDKKKIEYMQIATRCPVYEYGRRNGFFNVYTNFAIIHQSWARDRKEIQAKINNWGHALDFDKDRYFSFWDSLNSSTYKEASDFHFLQPAVWPKLSFVNGRSVPELMKNFGSVHFPSLSKVDLLLKNSLWVSRLKKLFKIGSR
jgi:hypothetical protein